MRRVSAGSGADDQYIAGDAEDGDETFNDICTNIIHIGNHINSQQPVFQIVKCLQLDEAENVSQDEKTLLDEL